MTKKESHCKAYSDFCRIKLSNSRKFGIARLGGVFAIYELLPAFIVSLVVIIIVSLATGGSDEKVAAVFDEVQSIRKSGVNVSELD